MIDAMATERLTISLDAELAALVRAAAEADRGNVSSWLADAARRRLESRGLRAVIVDWEIQHGAISEEERAEARRRLGWDQ